MSRLRVRNKYGKVEFHDLQGEEIQIGGSGSMDIQLKGLKGHQITIYHEDEEFEIEAQTQNSVFKSGKALKKNKLYDMKTGEEYKVEGFKLYLEAGSGGPKEKKFAELAPTVAIESDQEEEAQLGVKTKNKMPKKKSQKQFEEFATTLAVNEEEEEDYNQSNGERRIPKKGMKFSDIGATVMIPQENEDDDGFLAPLPHREKKKGKPKFDPMAATLAVDEGDEEDGDGFLAPLPQIRKKEPKKKEFSECAPTVGLPELDEEFEEEIRQKRIKKEKKKNFEQFEATVPVLEEEDSKEINLSGDTLPIEEMEENEVKSPKNQAVKRQKEEKKPKEEKEVLKEKKEPAQQRYIKRGQQVKKEKEKIEEVKEIEDEEGEQLVDEIFGLASKESKYAREMKKEAASSSQRSKGAAGIKVIESDSEEEELVVEKSKAKQKKDEKKGKENKEEVKRDSSSKKKSAISQSQQSGKRLRAGKLRIAVSGVKSKNKLINMISKIGAKIVARTDQEFDLLILEKPAKTAKVMIAIAKEIPIVNVRWLEDSVIEKKQLDYDEYSLDWSGLLTGNRTELPKKKQNLFHGKKVYIHSYLRPEDRADKGGMVGDLEEVVKATNGVLVKSYEKADYCIFPEKYVPEKKCPGKKLIASDIREAIFNDMKL